MLTRDALEQTLRRIDGRGYKAYRDIQNDYHFNTFSLHIDHVQGDPFATPSKVRVRVPQPIALIPEDGRRHRVRLMATEDYLARQVRAAIRTIARGHRGTGKSGAIVIDAGGQEVLQRTAVTVHPDWVEARLSIGLPAHGRRISGRDAEAMLCEELPRIVERSLLWAALDSDEARAFADCVENQEHIRENLEQRGLVAFVADGALLPRVSGVSDLPMPHDDAIAFRSPESLAVTFELPNPLPDGSATIHGMGVPEGITLITGGGYHGKSTLLRALERGVYPHVPGDGREYVVTRHDAVKIRAEDGRRVENTDISAFIRSLPYGRSTREFSTDDASGSTSQAANIVEALETGSRLLLLDEDTSATNFMVRDARMQALIHAEHEPITPFLDRAVELHTEQGVSTILVMGGCGDYLDVANTVIMMRSYVPHDATDEARAVAVQQPSQRKKEHPAPVKGLTPRIPIAESFDPSRGRREVKIDVKGLSTLLFGRNLIELRGVEQLIDLSQTRAVGYAIHLASERFMTGEKTLSEVLDALDGLLLAEGLDVLAPFRRGEQHPGDFAFARRYEIGAAINRLRTVQLKQMRND